jgi:hypothetical protein
MQPAATDPLKCMAVVPPFRFAELATVAGTRSWPNEDYAAVGPDWAIVLDRATHFDGADARCIHDVSWLVGHLGAALASQLILSRVSLPGTLAGATEATCAAHADTCDLDNPRQPFFNGRDGPGTRNWS